MGILDSDSLTGSINFNRCMVIFLLKSVFDILLLPGIAARAITIFAHL